MVNIAANAPGQGWSLRTAMPRSSFRDQLMFVSDFQLFSQLKS
jgi:hypothetical protein